MWFCNYVHFLVYWQRWARTNFLPPNEYFVIYLWRKDYLITWIHKIVSHPFRITVCSKINVGVGGGILYANMPFYNATKSSSFSGFSLIGWVALSCSYHFVSPQYFYLSLSVTYWVYIFDLSVTTSLRNSFEHKGCFIRRKWIIKYRHFKSYR